MSKSTAVSSVQRPPWRFSQRPVVATMTVAGRGGPARFEFVTQEDEQARRLAQNVCSVDCSHPTALTLTHHKGNNNPPDLDPADTSTGLVLHALQAEAGHPARQWVEKPYVSTNHFDIDALTSVWAYLNRDLAAEYSHVLELVAHLGDFREAPLGELRADSEVDSALKICCWLNTVERDRFSKPWEVKDSDEKFEWFIPRFQDILTNPDAARHLWEKEYNEVLDGFARLEGCVDIHCDLGYAVARPDRPLHYYSLFSRTMGADCLLTVYPDNKYELEAKYTQYVEFHSRPVWARLDFGPLTKVLNKLEAERRGSDDDGQLYEWVSDRLVYGGPLLRLDRVGTKLTTVQKYGHPTDRPMYSSAIPPEEMESVVSSFIRHGLGDLTPRPGGWPWEELQKISKDTDWGLWESSLGSELSTLQSCA